MNKRLIFTVVLIVISILTLASTLSFATDDQNPVNAVVDGARNVVNGAENTVEGAVNNIGNTMKDSANKTGNTMNNIGNTMTNTNNNMNMNVGNTANSSTNYIANRTATTRTADTGTFLGMNSTTWTWVVLAIAASTIIALVWYYSTRTTDTRRYDDGE